MGKVWARILRAPDMPTVLRTVLTNLRPISYDSAAGRLVLAGAPRYAESAISRMALVLAACRSVLGRQIEVVVDSDDPSDEVSPPVPNTPATGPDAGRSEGGHEVVPEQPAEPLAHPAQHPLVKEAIELFGARIVDIQHRRPSPPHAQPNPQGS